MPGQEGRCVAKCRPHLAVPLHPPPRSDKAGLKVRVRRPGGIEVRGLILRSHVGLSLDRGTARVPCERIRKRIYVNQYLVCYR